MDARVKFGHSMLNIAELFYSLPAGPISRTFVRYLFAFCSRPEAASDVIFSILVRLSLPNKSVKFCDPLLNSQKIAPEAIGGGIFDSFRAFAGGNAFGAS